MNILLIYPEFPDNYWWGFKHALKFTAQKSLLPPLGLLTVAAMLPSEWPKRLVDMNVREITDDDLNWADYAFVSGMLLQIESAHQVVARCKKNGVKVVAGGPLFQSEHEKFPEVDHFVLGEAEVPLAPFLADLGQGSANRIYEATQFADMTSTPIPLWELADLKQYSLMTIQFSRGCPFNCEFCDVTTLYGHQPRHKTAKQIIAELDVLYHNHHWRGGIFFVDDNLIGDKKYLKTELLPAIIDWQKDKRNIPFNTQISINLADDDDLLQMMHEAGFDWVFIGIETPDETSLAECGKSQSRSRDLLADVKRMQQAGLQVQGGFIIGFDSDTPSIFQRQMEFIEKSGIVIAMISLLQAYPNTRLYQRLKMEGRLLNQVSLDNVCATTNIVTTMDPEELSMRYRELLSHLYSPSNCYQRIRTLMQNYKTPKVRLSFQLRFILFFLRSILFLGFRDKGRFQYWQLFFWTFLHRPSLLPEAAVLSLQCYHLRKVCELRILSKQAQPLTYNVMQAKELV